MSEDVIVKTAKSPSLTIIYTVVVSAIIFGALGYWLGGNSGKEEASKTADNSIALVATQTATSSTSATSSTQISDQSAFKHSELGFSFALLKDYSVVDQYNCEGTCTANLTIVQKKTDNSFLDTGIKIIFYKTDSSLESLYNEEKANDKEILNISDTTIDSAASKKYTVPGMFNGSTYLSVKNGYKLRIDQYPDTNDKLLDQIVTSFKF